MGSSVIRYRRTSRAANASLSHPVRLSMKGLIAAVLVKNRHGMTCDEIERATGLRHQTASARVNEMAWDGQIEDTGRRAETSSGRKAIVWALA